MGLLAVGRGHEELICVSASLAPDGEDSQTDRQTDRETDRQTHTQRERERERERERLRLSRHTIDTCSTV
jgi:hypothetical protein